MGINRIVAKPAGLERERGIEPASGVVRGVVVPEVIMLVTRPQEEVIAEHSQVNHDRRRVKVATPGIDTGFEIDRGKEKAASFNWVVPEATDEDISARGPDIMSGAPIPIHPAWRPITGTPGVTTLIPYPAARRPTVVRGRRGDIGPRFHRHGRRRQVGCLPHAGIRPVPGSPLVALRSLSPVTRPPFTPGRQSAPGSADPKEIAPFVIPGPVARDPGDMLSLGPLFRRQFLDDLGRGFGHHDTWLGVKGDHLGEGLVYRPAGEDLCPWRLVFRLLGPADGRVETVTKEKAQPRAQATLECAAGNGAISSIFDNIQCSHKITIITSRKVAS